MSVFALPWPPVFLVSHYAAIPYIAGAPATKIAGQCHIMLCQPIRSAVLLSSIKYIIYQFYIYYSL